MNAKVMQRTADFHGMIISRTPFFQRRMVSLTTRQRLTNTTDRMLDPYSTARDRLVRGFRLWCQLTSAQPLGQLVLPANVSIRSMIPSLPLVDYLGKRYIVDVY